MTPTQTVGGVVLAVSLAAASAHPVHGSGGGSVFAWGPTTNRSIATNVEQQPGVTNPTTCVWSEDDELVNGSYGVLNPGTTSFTDCMIADNTQVMPPTHMTGAHLLGLQLIADTPNLIVQVSYQPQNVTFTFTPQLVSGRYQYQGCIVGPTPDGNQLQQIPNSNGGWGVQESITVLTANNTGHKWQKTFAQFYIWDDAPGLPNSNLCLPSFSGVSAPFAAGGASWQTGL